MLYTAEIPVRYAETDMMGVVHHASYLVYFEVARTEFMREMGFAYKSMEDAGFLSPVISIECSYGTPLVYGDIAYVETRVSEIKPAKLAYSYRIFKQGQDPATDVPCVTGTSKHCVVDAKTFKPVSMKRALPDLYELFRSTAEATE